MQGLVTRSNGLWYEVLTDGKLLSCRVKGKLKLEGYKETNPIAVGDYVLLDAEQEGGVITEILQRKNHIVRQSIKRSSFSHVLAANVDQVLLLATQKRPRTSLGFIDRFLVSAESFRIPQILIFNKRDLLSLEELQEQESISELYRKIGVSVFSLAALEDNIEFISSLLYGKITLVAGHSGVGKSTLLNRLSSKVQQQVGGISEFSNKGTHTTTFAEMFQLDEHSFVIDTPGVKEWGFVDMDEQEVSDYFPEMRKLRMECKFSRSCLHLNEPKCKILDAVQRGEIALSRYESYRSIVTGQDNRK
jgi:ribosome biogenesis GTPase / thiamine phosphate phosphatase